MSRQFKIEHNERHERALLCAICALLVLGGCASRSTVPPFQPSAAPPPPRVVSPDRPAPFYEIQDGDEIEVGFAFHNTLDTTTVVRPDGRITIPGLGDFYALGLTTDQLQADIYGRASITHRNPTVSVTVTESLERRAYVGGEVGRPGYVSLRPGLTTLRAITERGGFILSSEKRKVVLIKWAEDGTYAATQLNLREVLETGDSTQDLALSANDMIYVPPTGISNATTWVKQYIRDLLPVREPTLRGPDVLR